MYTDGEEEAINESLASKGFRRPKFSPNLQPFLIETSIEDELNSQLKRLVDILALHEEAGDSDHLVDAINRVRKVSSVFEVLVLVSWTLFTMDGRFLNGILLCLVLFFQELYCLEDYRSTEELLQQKYGTGGACPAQWESHSIAFKCK